MRSIRTTPTNKQIAKRAVFLLTIFFRFDSLILFDLYTMEDIVSDHATSAALVDEFENEPRAMDETYTTIIRKKDDQITELMTQNARIAELAKADLLATLALVAYEKKPGLWRRFQNWFFPCLNIHVLRWQNELELNEVQTLALASIMYSHSAMVPISAKLCHKKHPLYSEHEGMLICFELKVLLGSKSEHQVRAECCISLLHTPLWVDLTINGTVHKRTPFTPNEQRLLQSQLRRGRS